METYSIITDHSGEIPTIIIEGDLTSEADEALMSAYHELLNYVAKQNRRIVIDFSKTNYINSAGIATLINLIQDINELDGRITFTGLSNHFLKVMDIVGISDFVDIVDPS